MRTVTEESLRRRLARLESALESEKARLKVCGGIPWGAGMRRTKCTPSFRREDELIGKIKAVRQQLSPKCPQAVTITRLKKQAGECRPINLQVNNFKTSYEYEHPIGYNPFRGKKNISVTGKRNVLSMYPIRW